MGHTQRGFHGIFSKILKKRSKIRFLTLKKRTKITNITLKKRTTPCFIPFYHVSESSTSSGVSGFPISGSFLSSAESCAISSAFSSKSNIPYSVLRPCFQVILYAIIIQTSSCNTKSRRIWETFREIRYCRLCLLEEAKETVNYMDAKAAHYEPILKGLAPDDTNPKNWTAENRPRH